MEVSALSRAAGYGQLEMVKVLHEEFKAEINWITLGFANAGKHTETIKYLNSANAKKTATTHPIYDSTKRGSGVEKTEEEVHEL